MRIIYSPIVAVSTLLAALAASPAMAQDAMGPFNGVYAGINGGYNVGKNNITTTGQSTVNNSTVADGARPPFAKTDTEGFLGGVQVGYNWRLSDYLLVGLESDAQYTDMRDTKTLVTTGVAFPGVRNNQFRQNMNYFGTTRARLGYLWGNTLIYGTGGFAYSRLKEAVNFSGPVPAATPQFAGAYRRTNFGYTVGGGFEQFLDSNWSVKTEFLYYDLGRNDLFSNVITGSGGAGTGYISSFNNKGQIGRVGINYHLN